MNTSQKHPLNWWRGAFFYQIYPRSFMDSNSDGVGDLPGITQRLDYIADLGVEGIWISPFFKSPMKDFGYDVSDYRDIDPLFGTLSDFDALLEKAHSLGLKIIVDLVLSHTSNEHPWFHDPAKKDWYVWADAKPDGTAPNNWVSVFGGSAWEWDKRYRQYYLHNFLKEQPDLNYHNPAVQDAALDIARFWLDRGVDGFRLDVINFLFHDQELRDNPPRDPNLGAATQFEGEDPYSAQAHIYDKSRPEMLPFLRRFRALMDEYPDRFTIGEIGDDSPYERAVEYTAGDDLLNTTYNTQMMGGTQKALTASLIRSAIEKFISADTAKNAWPSWAFSNHDVVRAVSRWLPRSDGFSHDPALAKMLIALLGCLPGTVFLYQGEELGLPEAKLAFEDLKDPWGQRLWPQWQGRDGCRTPMPWAADSPYAGFSVARPWLPIPASHMDKTVDIQQDDIKSVLRFTKDFMHWRKTQTALRFGDIEFIDTKSENMLHFVRALPDGKHQECVFNLENYEFSVEGFSSASS